MGQSFGAAHGSQERHCSKEFRQILALSFLAEIFTFPVPSAVCNESLSPGEFNMDT